ncbi:tetratricopeptide repeat protein [Marseilla massiliensis]|uniref:Tetratricopeptide repeat protein n=1 Tax=Marseilla massiliensis TaxID=1841864 RepID=A0A938WQW3_9BACT|nr:tetratricopeptide repeat protein [Marseilla massiliensis]MBM6662729.1 tetratricopeptide repeat protein [Marseilla massiliensis]
MKSSAFIIGVCLLGSLSAYGQSLQQWRDSLSVLNRQIETSPYSSDLHLRKAAVNLELGQWDYAVSECGLVLDKEPRNLAALFYRAFANNNLRRYDLACNDYETFLGIAPYNMEARLGLAYSYRKLGRKAAAMDEMNRLVEQFPDSAAVYAARADFEKEQKVYGAALYDWEQAIRLAPANVDFRISRVDVLLLMGKKKEARVALDEMVGSGVPKGILRKWYDKCSN